MNKMYADILILWLKQDSSIKNKTNKYEKNWRHRCFPQYVKINSHQTKVMDGETVFSEHDLFPKQGWIIITEPAECTNWTHTQKIKTSIV